MTSKKYGVYILYEGDVPRYVGSGKVKDRIYRHLRGETSVGDYFKSKKAVPTWKVVFESDVREECYLIEEKYAREFKPILDGGTLLGNQYGYSASDTKKKLISDNHANVSGSNNPNFGGKWHGTIYRKPAGVPMNKWWTNGIYRVKCTKLDKPEGYFIIQPRSVNREVYMNLPTIELKDLLDKRATTIESIESNSVDSSK